MLQLGRAKEAFARYAAPNFVEHAHAVAKEAGTKTAGPKEAIVFFEKRFGKDGKSANPDHVPDIAKKARANDEMVTMFGDIGVDVFRVVDGRITDHWDASPPKDDAANVVRIAP